MKRLAFATACSALMLAACGQAGDDFEGSSEAVEAAADSSVAMAESASGGASAPVPGLDIAPLPATMPKLAYKFGLAFEAPAADLGTLMRRHAAVCEQQGAQSCRIVGMDLTGTPEDGEVRGTLQLAVAASHARAVSALLEREAEDMDASQTAATIGSEEVSKQIVDTEARIRARSELRDRLLEVLRNRQGKVSELVEAERQVAAVNEEIDQARSWLAETKGRVAFSQMEIDYRSEAGAAASFTAPIAGAFGWLGGVMGVVIAGLLLLGAVLAPIALTVFAGKKINRRFVREGAPSA